MHRKPSEDLREIYRIILEAELPVPTVIAIDPGPIQSAFVVWDGSIKRFGIVQNPELREMLRRESEATRCVIEQVASFGMPVGEEVFETVFWSGIFAEAFGLDRTDRLKRLVIKMHICHDSKAKDSNIRMSLIDRFGRPGTKGEPGVLYGVRTHVWPALAVAVTWWDRMGGGI